MNWYIVKIIYQVITGTGEHTPQFDEQFRIIRADELEWAWEKAQVLGRRGETVFLNAKNETVQWKFIAVEDVRQIHSMEDGEVVYSRTEEPLDLDEYITLTYTRANRLYTLCQQTEMTCSK